MPFHSLLRRVIPAVATVAGVALTVSLGIWQLNRAEEKRRLQDDFDRGAAATMIRVGGTATPADAVLFRRVEAEGTFDREHEILLDNRVYRGKAGYYVLTPLRVGGGEVRILVNRGWVGAAGDRRLIPAPPVPAGMVRVEGIAVPARSRFLELGKATVEKRVWQNLDWERYTQTVPFRLQSFVLRQTNDTRDGLIREWDRPDTGTSTHLGYAFQWFALAVLLVVTYGIHRFRRK